MNKTNCDFGERVKVRREHLCFDRFHVPHETSSELRKLHKATDRAVLEAYGSDDLAANARCEFLLGYEDEVEEFGSSRSSAGGKRGKKSPGAFAVPTTTATKSSLTSSNSMNNATSKNTSPERCLT